MVLLLQPFNCLVRRPAFKFFRNCLDIPERVHNQMDMIGHYHISDELEWMLLASVSNCIDKELADRVALEYWYALEMKRRLDNEEHSVHGS